MNTYTEQIFGLTSGSESSDLFPAQIDVLKEQYRKMKKRKNGKKRKGKKRLKRLKKNMRVLEQKQQQLAELEHEFHKLKKKKRGKKGKAKKKLNKRLWVLEQEREQLKLFIYFLVMYQCQMPAANPQPKQWWQEAVTNSLPKAFDLAIASMQKPTKSQPLLALPAPQNQK